MTSFRVLRVQEDALSKIKEIVYVEADKAAKNGFLSFTIPMSHFFGNEISYNQMENPGCRIIKDTLSKEGFNVQIILENDKPILFEISVF
jgi:hypothetical protein